MDATQMIDDYVLESDEEEDEEEERENKRGEPLAKLQVLKNEHILETELPLYLGENVLGRDPDTCNVPLVARSVSKQHTTICLTVYRGTREALVWDLGSMNGTRKGRRKLTPHVRYALSEGDSLVVADIPCQYVSCPVDKIHSQEERNPVDSGDSGRAHSSADTEKEAQPFGTNRDQDSGTGTSKDDENSVNRNKKALVRLLMTDEEESWKTPASTKALCSDKSRTQLQETLVPESDSDEDRVGRPGWRGKTVVSESDSMMSSPRSTLIPESPITPSSITNKPKKRVSFSEDSDAGRQQLRKKRSQVIADDSEEEEEPRKVSFGLPKEDGSPVLSTLASHAVAKPAFNMDSDTEEEEEEGDMKMSECGAGQLSSHSPAADTPAELSQFHVDSDTDVDEENESHVVVDAGAVSVPASDDVAKPTRRIPVVQPTGLTAEGSDTDDDIVSETATKTSAQPVDFHLDSDTDVEEEVQGVDNGPKNASSKLEATPTVLSNSGGIESMSAAPSSNLCLDSDTDDESVVPVVTGQLTGAGVDTGADLEILSDSDTDLEEDAPLLPPVVAKEASAMPSSLTKVMTDSSSTAGVAADVADLSRFSDTDIEENGEEGGALASEEGQFSGVRIPPLQRFSTPKEGAIEEMATQAFFNSSPDPLKRLHSNSSLPRETDAFRLVCLPQGFKHKGAVEEMETQAFFSSSPDSFKRPFSSSTRPISSSCSDSQEDDDPVVAETQSFILESRDRQANLPGDPTLDDTQSFALELLSEDQEQATTAGDSFQRGLSDRSQLPPQAQCLAMESTQNFVSMVGDVYLEATQAYLPVDLAMEATQVYGGEEKKPTQHINVATEATQAYIPESDSDTEDDEGDGGVRTDLATAETQPLVVASTSAIATAETQLMCAYEEEEDVAEVKPSPQEVSTCENLSSAETQPMMAAYESLPDSAKSQRLVESQESPLATVSLLSTAEIQPLVPASETEESDEDEPLPVTRKRTGKAKRLVESQESQLTTGMAASETEESEEEEPLPVTRKRRTKAQRLIESQESEVQEHEQVTKPLSPKRRGKSRKNNLQEEAMCSGAQVPTTETQPIATCEIEEGGKEDEPKVEAQTPRWPRGRGKGRESEAGPSSTGRRGRSARGMAAEDQEEPSGPPRRQTRGRGQTTSRGRRGKVAVPEEEAEGGDGESEEEEKVEPVTRGRGRKSSKQQRDKRAEEEKLEQEHKEMQGKLQRERDERERMEGEKRQREEERTRQETENREQEERERLERERREEEERQMAEREEREKQERVEREEKERLEREEKERIERERKGMEEKERSEKIRKEREEQERELRERKEREEREKLERENSEREERERTERERKKQEEKERIQQEKERLEREGREDEERLVREMAEREEREKRERVEREEKERLEREEKKRIERERKERERIEKERKQREKKEKSEKLRKEREEQQKELRERKEREEKERTQQENEERERLEREREEKEDEERKKEEKERLQKEAVEQQARVLHAKQEVDPKTPARGRRATRTTTMSAEVLEPEPNDSTSIGGPSQRTRSRSNSSNSVSSETSFSSINSQMRGRGRGTMKTSRPTAGNRSSGRRATVTGESFAERDRTDESRSNDAPTPGVLSTSKSNMSDSLNSEVSSGGASSLGRGRGRGRGRRSAPKPEACVVGGSQNDQASAPKTPARGRKIQKVEAASNDASQAAIEEKADSQQPGTTRGRRRAEASDTELTAAAAENRTTQVEESATEDLLEPNGNVKGTGQGRKSKPVEAAVDVNKEVEAKKTGRGKGRKRELEEEEGESSKMSQGKGKVQRGRKAEAAVADEEEGMVEAKEAEPAPAPANRGGRAQGRQSAKVPCADGESKVKSEKMEEETPRKKGRGRQSTAQKKKEERQEDGETSAHGSTDQDASASSSQVPETPNVSRKRGSPMESSTKIKSPRISGKAANQACKVLFTGVADETGEKVLSRLGGSLARDVSDMTYLVTDKVRRTVKFLCAVARGIPIVNTQWLQKCGKAGSFLPPNGFIVKDSEQEQKFNFCLQESLRTASNQPLLQGYEIHVTKSVLPEPVHMKDIISCSGATYLPKMPSKHKTRTVVVSCEKDWALCSPAVSASLPIVTAEFILTGILQQKVDLDTHILSVSAANTCPQAAAGRGRGRKKS